MGISSVWHGGVNSLSVPLFGSLQSPFRVVADLAELTKLTDEEMLQHLIRVGEARRQFANDRLIGQESRTL